MTKRYDYIDKDIYYVCSCDEWKSRSSMRIILITTDEDRLKDFLRKQIKNGDMEYDGKTKKRMLENFDEDWLTSNMADVNSKLIYGYYEAVADGEEV